MIGPAFWLALILAVAPAATNESAPAQAELFQCDFGESWDRNYDSWPDGWTRAAGPKYPNYVKIRLANDPENAANRCLQIDLDGGAAIAYGPAVPLNPQESLALTGRIKTIGLELHRARLSVTLLDATFGADAGSSSSARPRRLAVEMEIAALYIVAALHHRQPRPIRAGAIVAIDGLAIDFDAGRYNPHRDAVRDAIEAECDIAVAALRRLITADMGQI